MRILIVEDEAAMADGLKFNFEQEGYDVLHAGDGGTALKLFGDPDAPVDLVVLDLMLPDVSGYETCRAIREINHDVPVLVLSARTLSEDKTLAFDCGSDQYVTKPFALPELLSRVRNLLERRRASSGGETVGERGSEGSSNSSDQIYAFGKGVRFDVRRFEVESGGQIHALTKIETELLRYFIENAGYVLSRAQIMEDVWQENAEVTTRSIDNFVLRLRRIIEPDPAEPRHILSVRGAGYRFVADPDTEESL